MHLRTVCSNSGYSTISLLYVNRLRRLLSELLPSQGKRDLFALQARQSSPRSDHVTSSPTTRRRIAAEELADLVAVEAKVKKVAAELKTLVTAGGSRLMDIHGVGRLLW